MASQFLIWTAQIAIVTYSVECQTVVQIGTNTVTENTVKKKQKKTQHVDEKLLNKYKFGA